MIVLDDESNPDAKRPPARRAPGEGMSESSHLAQGPPPSYSDSQSYGTVYSPPLQFPDDVSTSNRRVRIARGEDARKRFWKAFAVAFGIWILIVILVDTAGDINQTANRKKSPAGESPPDNPPPETPDEWPPKSDKRIRFPFCLVAPSGDSTREGSDNDAVKVGFSLPATSDLAFFANDTISHGSFTIDAEESSTSDVEVDVVISYQTREALRRPKICLFEEGTKRTLGIMAVEEDRNPPSIANILRYDVYVKLPASEKRPLFISRLTADLPLFGIATTDLARRVEFGEVDLRTVNRIILAESLSARKARLETSQASIEGNFTISSSLELVTKNAPIQVDIIMLSSASSDQPPTQVAMYTKNAVISAQLDLANPSSSRSHSLPFDLSGDSVGGNFKIESTTSNAGNSISVQSQPYSSHLSLAAHSTNAACEVSLPQQFSGSFRLASSIIQPVLRVASPPTDKNRNREIDFTRTTRNLFEGTVSWFNSRGKKEGGGDFVDVTSVLLAILNL